MAMAVAERERERERERKGLEEAMKPERHSMAAL